MNETYCLYHAMTGSQHAGFQYRKHECEHFQHITNQTFIPFIRLYSFKYRAQFMDHLYFSFVVLSCTFSSLSVWGHFVLSPYGKQQCDNSAKHLLLCSLDKRMSYKVGCSDPIFSIGIAPILAFSVGPGYRSDEDWSKSDILWYTILCYC